MKKFLVFLLGGLLAAVSLTLESINIPKIPSAREPAIDMYSFSGIATTKAGNFVFVEANLPGIKPENITISVENNQLEITAKEEEKKEFQKRNFYKQELRHGKFEAFTSLPFNVDAQKATAELKDGVLTIKLPPSLEKNTKKLGIKVKAV